MFAVYCHSDDRAPLLRRCAHLLEEIVNVIHQLLPTIAKQGSTSLTNARIADSHCKFTSIHAVIMRHTSFPKNTFQIYEEDMGWLKPT